MPRIKRKTYKLLFEEWGGITVRLHSLPLGDFLELVELSDSPKSSPVIDKMFDYLIGALIGWDVEDEDGNPVPPTMDGLKSQDTDFGIAVVMAWQEAIAGVTGPLEQSSRSGASTDSLPDLDLPVSRAS